MILQYLFLRRAAVIFLFLCLIFVTSGCSPGQDTNETLYIAIVGIDKGDNDKIIATYQFETLKGNDEEGKGKDISKGKIITIEAENIYQTIDLMASVLSRTPNFAHVRAVVFSEEIAKQGISSFMSTIFRFYEFSNSAYILVTNNCTAKEFISKNQPTIETSSSKYIETQMALSKYTNIFLKSSIHDFYNRMKSNSAAPYASLGGVNSEENIGEKGGEKNLYDGKDDGIYAGDIPRQGEANPAEIAGVALFRQDRMVGKLNCEEALIASIFRKDFKYCIIQIADPYAPGFKVGFSLRSVRSPEIKVWFEDGKPKIKVKIDFICSLNSIPSGISYEKREYREELEKIIAGYMLGKFEKMLTKTQSVGSDIVGFGYRARGQFKRYQEFMAVNWDDLYSQAEFDVKVTVKIKNSGLMGRTTPL